MHELDHFAFHREHGLDDLIVLIEAHLVDAWHGGFAPSDVLRPRGVKNI